ncbi:MAG: hypothetical protein RLO17_14265 [Cyclobacteriaceae bacterium]
MHSIKTIIFLTLLSGLVSCNKNETDEDQITEVTISGYFSGTYNPDSESYLDLYQDNSTIGVYIPYTGYPSFDLKMYLFQQDGIELKEGLYNYSDDPNNFEASIHFISKNKFFYIIGPGETENNEVEITQITDTHIIGKFEFNLYTGIGVDNIGDYVKVMGTFNSPRTK